MQPDNLAEAAEALGMRVQLSEEAEDEEPAKPKRSRFGEYNHMDHAWTGTEYDMSNEK